MKTFLKILTVFGLFFALSKSALALEGTFELRSTDENNYKCFAASLQMINKEYRILYSCRGIVFPIDETIYTYVLWANPANGDKQIKLGSIGLGRGQFVTKTAFTSLFVTAEQNKDVKEPSGKVLMKGSIKPVKFLEQDVQDEEEEEGETDEVKKDEKSPTPTPEGEKTSIRDRIVTGLKRAGLASALALVAILGLVFVLTRPK